MGMAAGREQFLQGGEQNSKSYIIFVYAMIQDESNNRLVGSKFSRYFTVRVTGF